MKKIKGLGLFAFWNVFIHNTINKSNYFNLLLKICDIF